MGNRKKRMMQRSRRRGPEDGTHADKYATQRPARSQSATTTNAPGGPTIEPTPASPARPPVLDTARENERRVHAAARALHDESEEVLASLPGGTIDERLRSARRGLLQDQDTIQSTLTPPNRQP